MLYLKDTQITTINTYMILALLFLPQIKMGFWIMFVFAWSFIIFYSIHNWKEREKMRTILQERKEIMNSIYGLHGKMGIKKEKKIKN